MQGCKLRCFGDIQRRNSDSVGKWDAEVGTMRSKV